MDRDKELFERHIKGVDAHIVRLVYGLYGRKEGEIEIVWLLMHQSKRKNIIISYGYDTNMLKLSEADNSLYTLKFHLVSFC